MMMTQESTWRISPAKIKSEIRRLEKKLNISAYDAIEFTSKLMELQYGTEAGESVWVENGQRYLDDLKEILNNLEEGG